MRLKLAISYCLIFVGGSCAQKSMTGSSSSNKTEAISELRVLCYNIHHANPPSKPGIIDLEAIAEVIKQNTPDLVALQEVDVNTTRSGITSNQAADLANLSGLPYYFFAKAIDYGGGAYGVAILSKYPMEEMKNSPLPTANGTGGEYRTLATAIIKLPQGKKIVFANTHLDAQRSDTNRLLQINKVVEILQHETLPVVIAGDFNATPSTRIINQLDQHFTRSCITNCGFTIPVNIPAQTIDFIAYKPFNLFKIKEHKVIDEKYASDHLPVMAVLNLKEQ